MKNLLKHQIKELARRVNFPMLVFLYETGRIIAVSKSAELLIGENCKSIGSIWEDKTKQKIPKDMLDNRSYVLYQRYIVNKKDRLVVDMEVSVINLSEEHLVIILFEESYKRPFCRTFRKQIPRMIWRNKRLEVEGCNTFVSGLSDIRCQQEDIIRTQEGQFDLLEEVWVGEDTTSFAKVNRIVLLNKNGTSVGTLSVYSLLLQDEEFQSFQNNINRENNILIEVIKRSEWVAVTWEKGEEGIIDYISPNIARWGYSMEEFYEGRLVWKDIVLEEDYPLFKYKNTVGESMKGGAFNLEYRIRKKDQKIIWIRDETIECTIGDATKYKQGILKEIEDPEESKGNRVHRLLKKAMQIKKETPKYMVFFQPIVDRNTKAIVAAEALLRWENDKHEMVSPMDVLTASAYLGLIGEIGDFVFHEAFIMCKQKNETEDTSFRMHINLSIAQLMQPNIVEQVSEVQKKTQVNPSNVVFEVKETLSIEDIKLMKAVLLALKEEGFRILLDDFGTGICSLNTVMELPLDYIKVDESFIATYGTEKFKPSLLTAIVEVAHSLNKKVIVSGIETKSQMEFLILSDIDEYQGYYFGYPVPKSKFQNKGEIL